MCRDSAATVHIVTAMLSVYKTVALYVAQTAAAVEKQLLFFCIQRMISKSPQREQVVLQYAC